MSVHRKNAGKIVVVMCVAAITAFAGIVHADTGGWGGDGFGKHRHHRFMKLAKALGLSDDQKAQSKAIFQANKDVVKPILVNLRAERKNLRALIHADTVDEAAIRAETAKIAAIQADLNVNRAKVGAQFRAILTPAQLASLKTLGQKGSGLSTTTTTTTTTTTPTTPGN